jgi:hypothetical protein
MNNKKKKRKEKKRNRLLPRKGRENISRRKSPVVPAGVKKKK